MALKVFLMNPYVRPSSYRLMLTSRRCRNVVVGEGTLPGKSVGHVDADLPDTPEEIGRALEDAVASDADVVIINADKVALTGSKKDQKFDYRHSGYPGGMRATSYGDLLQNNPRRVIEKAVKGMLPHNKLGRQQLKKLKVYAGSEHPHAAQQPQPFQITQVAQ